jgi:Rrf2 family protein
MKLSTKGRYGLRLMLDLAISYGSGPIALKDVAQRQEISEKYLWHLIPPLKSAGLLTSIRGSRGGYTLARSPREINVLEIVTAVEGPMCLVDCTHHPAECSRAVSCVAREVWQEASARMAEYLAGCTLEQMVERQKGKQEKLSYSI